MESVLIVSCLEKSTAFFADALSDVCNGKITTIKSCGEARRLFLEQSFDLCVINTPLKDETGENLAKYIASSCISQVILVVKEEYYDAITVAVEEYGVLTVAKPTNKSIFLSAVKFAKAAGNKLKLMQAENNQLTKKIQDIRIVDRAKCILISQLSMTEPEAHKHIEKQAMDLRKTKRAVAEEILREYES